MQGSLTYYEIQKLDLMQYGVLCGSAPFDRENGGQIALTESFLVDLTKPLYIPPKAVVLLSLILLHSGEWKEKAVFCIHEEEEVSKSEAYYHALEYVQLLVDNDMTAKEIIEGYGFYALYKDEDGSGSYLDRLELTVEDSGSTLAVSKNFSIQHMDTVSFNSLAVNPIDVVNMHYADADELSLIRTCLTTICDDMAETDEMQDIKFLA
jgi:hypothetical protein